MTTPLVHGTTTASLSGLRTLLEGHLATGAEVGASIVVDVGGETVADLWGGHADGARTRPWERDTVVNVWSITKQVTALAALMLADRGLIDLGAPLARHWPEFAANGKDHITVRQVLAHASGVSGLAAPAALADLYDHDAVAGRLAAQEPWWEPGTASGYHLWVYGHLLGELVRRVDGRDLGTFVAQEIAGPLSADFGLGATPGMAGRIADVVPPPPLPFDIEDLDHRTVAYRTFSGPLVEARAANSQAWRAARIGAANGHGNARSVARILAQVAGDGRTSGVRLLEPGTGALVLEPQTDGVDLVNGLHVRWGLGFAVADRRTLPWVPEGRIAYWGGWGGSMAIVDLDRRMTIVYVMNRMGGDILGSDRAAGYVTAIYDALR
jgi:CubicO group peptidase (beta-lactamase class C family)